MYPDSFTFIDYMLTLLFVWIWSLFIVIWADKLYKIYFGVIIWFLIFLTLNAQIENLEIIYSEILWPFQSFLVKNKETVLWTITCFIPIFWVFAALNQSVDLKQKPRIATIIITWTFLPIVILWIFAYISVNSYARLEFLSDILSIFSNSYIFHLLKENNYLVFLTIIFLIFYKIILSIFVYMFSNIFSKVITKVKEKYYQKEKEMV